MQEATNQFYVRYRGRKSGPFTSAQLEQMKRRSQVTRFHEFSQDGLAWGPFDEIVASAQMPFSDIGSDTPDDSLVPEVVEEPPGAPSTTLHIVSDRLWFYAAGKDEYGPVSDLEMQELLATGVINARTSVWCEGMAEWQPLKQTDLIEMRTSRSSPNPNRPEAAANSKRRVAKFAWAGGAIAALIATAAITWLITSQDVAPTQPNPSDPASETVSDTTLDPTDPSDPDPEFDLETVGTDDPEEPVDPTEPTEPKKPAEDDEVATSDFVGSVRDAEAIAESVGFTVVGLRVTTYDGRLSEFPMSTGSAFAISEDGHMVTNKHVVEAYRRMQRATQLKQDMRAKYKVDLVEGVWIFVDGEKHPATLVWASPLHDIAIVKIDHRFKRRFRVSASGADLLDLDIRAIGFPGIASHGLSDSETIRESLERREKQLNPPEDIAAHFKDRDFRFSLTAGRVSQIAEDSATGAKWLQHSAVISPGSSGGPLVTVDGLVLGINTSVVSETNANTSSSRSISIGQFRSDLDKRVEGIAWED